MRERKRNRLNGYDYSTTGIYFVTICVHNRGCVFGEIVNGEMILNEMGGIVESEWKKSFVIRNELFCDEYVIMPNHFHGIILIVVGSQRAATPQRTRLKPGSLPVIVGSFKLAVTKQMHETGYTDFAWQKSIDDRIIRNQAEFHCIQYYIEMNPINLCEIRLTWFSKIQSRW